MTTIYRGDDTGAFDKNFITIRLTGLNDKIISKAIFQCGPIGKTFVRPEFPIVINFTSAESSRLYEDTECYLQLFDEKGRRQTCKSVLKFKTITQD